jgi:hypothetical protein
VGVPLNYGVDLWCRRIGGRMGSPSGPVPGRVLGVQSLPTRSTPKDTMVSTDGHHEGSVDDIACVGSGSIPEVFDDVTQGTQFASCSVCGRVVPADHVVRNH